jgi:UbiD family decarboxylase
MDSSRGYPDLHDHLARLDQEGLLVRVRRPIDKDSELHPLVRWQFRGGIDEPDRRAFLFENVVDASGRRYDIPVAVGALAANRRIYSLGIGCELSDVRRRWARATANPVRPVEIPQELAPVQEVVEDTVENLPVPVSTPGWDNGPYVTAAHYVTRDPDTGTYNVGNYRAQVKGPKRVGCNISIELGQGGHRHWLKYRERGEPMPAALCIGGPPCLSYVAVQKLAYDQDEYWVAGGLVGAPLRLTKARTLDLLVPADGEIVVEGYVSTEWLEPEAPFGESHGHVNPKEYNLYMDVTAVTRRRDAVLASIISQVTPSESGLIKKVAYEPLYLDHLRDVVGVKSVTRVALHEPLTSLQKLTVVQFHRPTRVDVWRALMAAVAFRPSMSKIVVAVDDDIDPDDADAVWWAIGYRSRPHRDLQVLHGTDVGHGPRHDARGSADDAAVLWDATLKQPFPPVSLPKREYMERARAIWEELGLPKLKPRSPWYGYSLGDWNEELDREAELAARGRSFETGEKAARERRRTADTEPNTSYYGGPAAEEEG